MRIPPLHPLTSRNDKVFAIFWTETAASDKKSSLAAAFFGEGISLGVAKTI